MKRIIFIFLSLFCMTAVFAQGMQFETGSWQAILDKAKKENKLVFVDCITVWCKPCKWMEQNVFTTDNVGEYFNENFLNVKMDMEKGEGKEVRKRYNINAYPAFLFLDGDGNLLHQDGGAKNVEDFLTVAKTATDPSKNLAAMDGKYKSGDRSITFLRKYIPALGRAHQKNKQKEVFNNYFNLSSKDEFINEEDFDVLMSIAQPGDSAFQFVLENHEKYKALVGYKKYDSKMYAKFIVPFSQLVYKNNVENLKTEAEKYKKIYPSIVQKAEDMAMIRWHREINKQKN